MSYISKLNVDGVVYNIKDAEARELIKGGVTYIGLTTTTLYDEATISPIIIDGAEVTPQAGYLVRYNNGTKDLEFIWNGEHWDELGSTGALKALAYQDEVNGTLDWTHTHTIPTEETTVNLNGGVTVGVAAASASLTPTGTITIGGATGAEYEPAGTITVGEDSNKDVTGTIAAASPEYTPEGEITQTGSFEIVGTAPEIKYNQTTYSYDAATECLTFGADLVATTGSKGNVTCTVNDKPTYTFTGTPANLSHDHTFSGSVSVPSSFTFTGTPTKFDWSGTIPNHTHTITQGTVTGNIVYTKITGSSDSAGSAATIISK